MPWVDKEKCNGCGICVEKCPVDAITMVSKKAEINMEECIHCGTCHGVCQQEAVRHDGEKTPEDVKANVEMTKRFMEFCSEKLGNDNEKDKCLTRMKKYFNRAKIVAEKTLEELEKL